MFGVLGADVITGDQRQQLVERRARVAHQRQRGVLARIDLGDVDRDEPDPLVLERGLRGGREVAQPRADDDHEVGVAREEIGRTGAGRADAAERQWMRIGQRSLARLRLADGDAGRVDESAQRVGGVAVEHAAAGDDERPRAGADRRRGLLQSIAIGARARDRPDARLEQRRRVVVGLGLHVLRQRQRDRAGLRRRRQHAHRFGQRRDDLLRPVDPIPVARHRLEAVVHRDVLRLARLELLQHGRRSAAGEDVARQQQDRHAVDGGARRAGDHVGGARADRRCAGERAQPVVHLGVGGRGVHHRLLVARQVVAHRAALFLQRLPDAGDVAVPEDAEHAAEERLFAAVTRGSLLRQESHHRLRHRHPHARAHIAGSFRSATKADTSSSVGMKLAQPWRVTTIAPQALPMRAARSSGQPWR